MKEKGINRIGMRTAILSFMIGTAFFLVFYFFGSSLITVPALFFIIIAGLLNIGILLTLVFKSIAEKRHRKSYLKTVGLMLLNIPVVVMYSYFVIMLLDVMRIKFINETGKPITEVKISGCESRVLGILGINESEKIWIDIKGDCSLRIEYEMDGKIISENVIAYVTTSEGKKLTHRIGAQEKAYY